MKIQSTDLLNVKYFLHTNQQQPFKCIDFFNPGPRSAVSFDVIPRDNVYVRIDWQHDIHQTRQDKNTFYTLMGAGRAAYEKYWLDFLDPSSYRLAEIAEKYYADPEKRMPHSHDPSSSDQPKESAPKVSSDKRSGQPQTGEYVERGFTGTWLCSGPPRQTADERQG